MLGSLTLRGGVVTERDKTPRTSDRAPGGVRPMDEFASFNENFVLALFAVLLLTAMWARAIVAIDHWVWAGRSNCPEIAPQSAQSDNG